METDQFIEKVPVLYHMAEEGAWKNVRRHGLLSTSALLDLFRYEGKARRKIESEHRPASVPIHHPHFGTAIVRDQIPQPPASLARCLPRGVAPGRWYAFLNGKVFFWASRARLLGMLNARSYRGRIHLVLVVNTRALVERHGGRVTLTTMNSGYALRSGPKRSFDSFTPIHAFDQNAGKIAEVAVDGGVPDIADLVVRAARMKGGRTLGVGWKR